MQNFILDIVTYSNPWNGYQFRENVVMIYMTHGCITNEDLQLQQHLDYHIKGHLCLCHRSAIKKPLSPRSTLQMAKCHLSEYSGTSTVFLLHQYFWLTPSQILSLPDLARVPFAFPPNGSSGNLSTSILWFLLVKSSCKPFWQKLDYANT